MGRVGLAALVGACLLYARPAAVQEPAAQPTVDESQPVDGPPPSAQAVDYYESGNWLWAFDQIWSFGLLVVVLATGLSARMRTIAQRASGRWFVALLVYFLLFNLFSLIVTPAILTFTRHVEHEADRFGLEITQTSHSAATAFIKLQTDALAVPRPGLLNVLWRQSHPPLGERIDFANQYHPWRDGKPLVYGDKFR